MREGRLRLTVVLWSIVRVSWLGRRDGRGACTCSRVDRVRQPPGLLRRITWLIVTSSTSLLDGGESDWRLAVVFIITRPRQFTLGSFTHTTNAAKAREYGDGENPKYNTDNSANAQLGV